MTPARGSSGLIKTSVPHSGLRVPSISLSRPKLYISQTFHPWSTSVHHCWQHVHPLPWRGASRPPGWASITQQGLQPTPVPAKRRKDIFPPPAPIPRTRGSKAGCHTWENWVRPLAQRRPQSVPTEHRQGAEAHLRGAW